MNHARRIFQECRPSSAHVTTALFHCLLVCMFLLFPHHGQAQDRLWSVILTSGDTLSACDLRELKDSTLFLAESESLLRIPLDSLRMLIHHKQTQFRKGSLYGGLAGLVIGGVAGAITYEEPDPQPSHGLGAGIGPIGPQDRFGSALISGLGGGIIGFIVGGAVGYFVGGADTYDLSSTTTAQKVKTIRPLIRKSQQLETTLASQPSPTL